MKVAVVGAGAVGSYFGGMVARAGVPVTLIGRAPHVDAIAAGGLFLDGTHVQERIPVAASTELSAARDAEIVLLSVKTVDTERTARELAPHVAPGAIVISLQNGVDNVERIRAAARIDALAAVVYIGVAMPAPGHVKHSGGGHLVIGDPSNPERDLTAIASLFEHAGIGCRISENINADLWSKLILNAAYNALSALTRAPYGRIIEDPAMRATIVAVVEEALAVAAAAGIRLPPGNAVESALSFPQSMPNQKSSTEQDIARGNRTEIDSLNGYIAKRGAELGVKAPVNEMLHALVKLLEESAASTLDGTKPA